MTGIYRSFIVPIRSTSIVNELVTLKLQLRLEVTIESDSKITPTYAYLLSATYLLDCTLLYFHALLIARHTLNDNRRRRCSTFPKAVGPRRRLEVPG